MEPFENMPREGEDRGVQEPSDRQSASEQRPGGKGLFLWIVLAIVIVILFAWLAPSQDQDDTQELSSDQVVPEEVEVDEQEAESALAYKDPKDWELTQRAESAINAYLGTGQKIEFGIVQDPTDENIVYFASSTYDREANENLVSIYKYRSDNYNFERLLRKTYNPGKDGLIAEDLLPAFHVIGYVYGSLILFVQSMEASLEACEQPILLAAADDASTALLRMSLEDPYGGFEEYTPSQESLDEAGDVQETCEAESES